MEKRFLLFLVFAHLSFCLLGDNETQQQINLEHKHTQGNHNEYYPPADMPEAYYDTNTEEIIIIADGFSSYYDVDIVSQSTMQLVLYTTISGYGDSIDVSLLPDDDYTIIITSSYGNEYEGHFTNY